MLPGNETAGRINFGDISARLICATVSRAEVISGWDLANWRPKPALRAVPTGSVYWLEDLDATPQALCKLVETGLWGASGYDAQRKAEGFNRFTFANY